MSDNQSSPKSPKLLSLNFEKLFDWVFYDLSEEEFMKMFEVIESDNLAFETAEDILHLKLVHGFSKTELINLLDIDESI